MFDQFANQMNEIQNESDESEEEYEIIEYDLLRYDSQDLAPSNVNFILPGKSKGNITQSQSNSYQNNLKLNSDSRCLCNLKNLQNKNLSSSNFVNMRACTCEKEANYDNCGSISYRNIIRNDYYINECTCHKY
jgi:hypothetical protein